MFQPIRFGKYLLLDRIGRGGMAEIFLAKLYGAEGFEKELVIKRILPEWSANQSFLSMLIDEAKLAVLLNHANIVQIYELGREGQGQDTHYIAMEYVDGVDLRRLWDRVIEKGLTLPLGVSLYIMGQILDGLSYAHRKKNSQGENLRIIHRDISPQNILISFDGAVKLTDFGIAKATLRSAETASGVHKGKFAYMSPEQANLQEINQSTDVFACGIVLYEILTGRRLFGGGSDIETLDRIRKTEIHFLPEDEKRLPPALVKIVKKALARDIHDRFADAASFREEILHCASEAGITTKREGLSDYVEDLFSGDIKEKKLKAEERRQVENSLSKALPTDMTKVLVTHSKRREPSFLPPKRFRFSRKILLQGAAAAVVLTVSLMGARWMWKSHEGQPANSVRESPMTSISPMANDERPRELGVAAPAVPATSMPTSPPPVPTAPQPSQPSPDPVVLITPKIPQELPPKLDKPEAPKEGPGFLSVLAMPWGYVSIDGGSRRESPVQKISLKSGKHSVKVFYEPELLTLNTTVEVKPGGHSRCVANFEGEKKTIHCR